MCIRDRYNAGVEEYNSKISIAEETLAEKEDEFNTAKSEFEKNQKPQLETAIATCKSQIEALQAQFEVTEDETALAAVSYTHLDVYKRQIYFLL